MHQLDQQTFTINTSQVIEVAVNRFLEKPKKDLKLQNFDFLLIIRFTALTPLFILSKKKKEKLTLIFQ